MSHIYITPKFAPQPCCAPQLLVKSYSFTFSNVCMKIYATPWFADQFVFFQCFDSNGNTSVFALHHHLQPSISPSNTLQLSIVDKGFLDTYYNAE